MAATITENWSDTTSAVASDILDLLDQLERAAAGDTAGAADRHLRSFRKGLIVAVQKAKTRRLDTSTLAA